MAAKKSVPREKRRLQRAENFRKRVPTQPDGMPQGKHLSGFKGMRVDGVCYCGGCNPAARKAKDKVVVIHA